MRTGQKVRVQDGTGGGIGGGRAGQTTHVRAPGGGPLFEHGVVLAKTNAYNNFAFDAEALWDTDGYFDPDGDVGVGGIAIPAGLGGVYLLQANWPYSKASAPTSGWWKMAFQRNGTDELGQWQQGYRALAELRSAGSMVNLVWVGVLADGDTIGFAITGYGDSVGTLGAGAQFSAFRLGAVGETGFHGALMYRDTQPNYDYGDYGMSMTGAVLFDTDGYDDPPDGCLQVPAGMAGLYVACCTWTFKVGNLADWSDTTPPITWPYGYDFASIPIVYGPGSDDPPDVDGNRYPAQAMVSGVDINDCKADVNDVAVTSFWIGKLRVGDSVEMLAIPDVLNAAEIVQELDPALSYFALVRIAE